MPSEFFSEAVENLRKGSITVIGQGKSRYGGKNYRVDFEMEVYIDFGGLFCNAFVSAAAIWRIIQLDRMKALFIFREEAS